MESTKDSSNESKDALKEYGIIFLSASICSSTAEAICREIIEHNVTGKLDHIQMIINSPGGEVNSGFAIIDIMEWSTIPVYTTGMGLIASMGLMIFMAGTKGRRVLTPRTSILSHRFSGLSFGNHSQLLAARKQEDILHERIIEHYKSYSNLKCSKEIEDSLLCETDKWLSPEDAIQFGLADEIESFKQGRLA